MHHFSHRVTLSDTDATGQVYYARPLEWLEWCRVDWFRSHYGNFLARVAATGITYFPSRLSIEYQKPLWFDEALEIEMRVGEIKKASFVFEYVVLRSGEPVLVCSVTMVCFDNRRRALARLDDDLLARLRALQDPPPAPSGPAK